MDKIGVLLVNLGTPDSTKPADVRKYLIEFLTDGRVIDIPWLRRQFIVRGMIVPKRYKESAKNYARIWMEQGSPLKIHTEAAKKLLQEELGKHFQVEMAMRYQNPSIETGLNKLKNCPDLIILPLFPQYASATTGSVHQKIMELISKWRNIPRINFINSYPKHNKMIAAFCERGREYNIQSYDHYLFSFHGLPEKHILKADNHNYCLNEKKCCLNYNGKNKHCYSAQCHATAMAIVNELQLPQERISITFQSRLGKDPWLKPYTTDTVKNLRQKGSKRILVFSPAFVCDCLETLDEIGNELRNEFIHSGGEALDLVKGLNDHPLWIDALKTLVLEHS